MNGGTTAPEGGADALLAMLLRAREEAMKLNDRLTAHFLEMASLDVALESAASWSLNNGNMAGAPVETLQRKRTAGAG